VAMEEASLTAEEGAGAAEEGTVTWPEIGSPLQPPEVESHRIETQMIGPVN
jgi:hypothetical protein